MAQSKTQIRELRRTLLKVIREEKARHWKMRGTHKLGQHFERGFFRGLNHASELVEKITKIYLSGD